MGRNTPTGRGRVGRPSATTAVATGPDRAVRDLTRLFKSLADEQRLRILRLLTQNGEMHVSAIGDELGQSQPAVSHHLTQLRNAGLIDFRRDGKFNYYSLAPDGLVELFELLFPDGGTGKVQLGGVELSVRRKG